MKKNKICVIFIVAIFCGICLVYFIQSRICKCNINNYYYYYNNINEKERNVNRTTQTAAATTTTTTIAATAKSDLVKKVKSEETISVRPSTMITLTSNLNIVKLSSENRSVPNGILKVNQKNIKMFTHKSHDHISKYILNVNSWEEIHLKNLLTYLSSHKRAQFIDLGCNLGVYSLAVAAHGYRVIAVDANEANTHKLMQSVVYNNFLDKIVIITNAISNVRKEYSMNLNSRNIGAQLIIEPQNNAYKVKSILLDDLLPLIEKGREVVIKMDIEGSEIRAIEKAGNLFEERQIVAVFMEWVLIKFYSDCRILINFFLSRNYRAYPNFDARFKLNVKDYVLWPDEIIWRKLS